MAQSIRCSGPGPSIFRPGPLAPRPGTSERGSSAASAPAVRRKQHRGFQQQICCQQRMCCFQNCRINTLAASGQDESLNTCQNQSFLPRMCGLSVLDYLIYGEIDNIDSFNQNNI